LQLALEVISLLAAAVKSFGLHVQGGEDLMQQFAACREV